MSAIVSGEDSTQDAVELRVHGVSGTPAEDMLDCPTEFLKQEAGDKYAGFYRCRPCEHDDPATGGPAVKEAYSWGGLTSGSATRALWLLFLPFILINLAHWMLPPSETGRRSPGVAVTALRLIALSLTLTLMLASVQVAVDVIGWQCAAMAPCGSRLGPLSGLTYAPDGIRVAVTALPVALMLALLLFLGRANPASAGPDGQRSQASTGFEESMGAVDEARAPGEKTYAPTKAPPPDPAVTTADIPLAKTTFWNPDDSVKRLRACHVMAWASGLGAVVLVAPVRLVDGWPVLRFVCVILLAANVVVLAASIAMTWSTPITGRGGPGADQWNKWMPRIQWASVGLLGATLLVVGFTEMSPHPPPAGLLTEPTHLPGLRYAVYGLLLLQGVMLAALFIATARCMNMKWLRCATSSTAGALVWPVPQLIRTLRRRPAPEAADDGWAPTVHGFGAPLIATIAILAAGGFSTGIGLWSSQYLGNPVPSTQSAQCLTGFRAAIMESSAANAESLLAECSVEKRSQLPGEATTEMQIAHYDADTPLIVPPAYFVAALVFFGLLATFVAAALLIWRVVSGTWTKDALSGVEEDYPDQRSPADDARILAVARARAVASLTDYAPTILARLTGLAVLALLVLGVPFTYIYFSDGFGKVPITVPVLSNLSVASISATAAGVVVLAAAAFRNRQQRRVVGILWDVITFWPRANHPLTPPCYAERTVPDLKKQLACLTEKPASRVVMSAHSQGSIIAAATLLQEDVTDSARVGLLTFGCPLRRLYGRNFPAYFGRHSMDRLTAKQDNRWLNLWACTDPIGGWVFSQGEPVRPASLEPEVRFSFDRDVVDHRLLDAFSLAAAARGMQHPICGHSGFWTRKEYESAVGALTAPGG
jgi:hypothetical protein